MSCSGISARLEGSGVSRSRGWRSLAASPKRGFWAPKITLLTLGAIACDGCGGAPTSINTPPPPPPGNASYAIEYGTFVGGNGPDEIRDPVLLPGGRVLFGARAESTDMPTTAGAFQRSYGGPPGDSYLAILSADGSRLEAATYFGGSGMERPPYGIALAAGGDIVFGSATGSPDLPTPAGAFRRNVQLPPSRRADGYVCRISGDLRSLRWCTYTGGGWPRGGLALDAQENVIVVGDVMSDANFPTTPGALQSAARGASDVFVLKLNSSGTAAIFSTRLGGSGSQVGEVALSVRTLANGDLSIVGSTTSTDFPTTSGSALPVMGGIKDLFFARLDASGSDLVYSTYLGGSQADAAEHRHLVASDGSVLAVGVTQSTDLPGAQGGLSGANDGLFARLAADGAAFDLVRYLGGSGDEHLLGPEVDAQGNIYVFGSTTSRDLQTSPGAIQGSYRGGSTDGVLFILDPSGSVRYATYLGGSGTELIRGIAIGPTGEIYLGGRTDSPDFPVTQGAFQTSPDGQDGFVIKLVPTGQ